MNLKDPIKKLFKIFGLSVSKVKFDIDNRPNAFVEHGVTLIFDIGANCGQFGEFIRNKGFNGRIISFEPLDEAHKKLISKAKSDRLWEVAPKAALGSKISKEKINVSENSVSSSILEMLPEHLNSAVESRYIFTEEISVLTLDNEYLKYMHGEEILGSKIDVQGFEKEVLLGASNFLNQAKVIQIELSLVHLYSGAELYEYFFEFFKQKNYILWNIVPGHSNRKTGQLLQFDAIFVKKQQ